MQYLSFVKKNPQILNRKEIDDSTENISGLTDGHQNYKKWECKARIKIIA